MGQPHHHGDRDLLGDLPNHLVDLIRMDREVLHLGPDGGEAAELQRVRAEALHRRGGVGKLGGGAAADVADQEAVPLPDLRKLPLQLLEGQRAVERRIK